MTDGFTPAQQRAIEAGDGPVAIIAGPGCGKTSVLAARIAHLVRDRGADPSSILAVTFTAEAARRLRHEVGRQLDTPATDLAIQTLHAFGRKVIETWPSRFGFPEGSPTVVHRDEERDLLVRAAARLGGDLSNSSPSELAAAVDRCRLAVDVPVAQPTIRSPRWPRRTTSNSSTAGLSTSQPCSAGHSACCARTARYGTFCSRLTDGCLSTRRRTLRLSSLHSCSCSPQGMAT